MATAAAPKIAEKLHEVLVLENWSSGCEPSPSRDRVRTRASVRSSAASTFGSLIGGNGRIFARVGRRGLFTLRGRLGLGSLDRGDGPEWLDVVDQRGAPRLDIELLHEHSPAVESVALPEVT